MFCCLWESLACFKHILSILSRLSSNSVVHVWMLAVALLLHRLCSSTFPSWNLEQFHVVISCMLSKCKYNVSLCGCFILTALLNAVINWFLHTMWHEDMLSSIGTSSVPIVHVWFIAKCQFQTLYIWMACFYCIRPSCLEQRPRIPQRPNIIYSFVILKLTFCLLIIFAVYWFFKTFILLRRTFHLEQFAYRSHVVRFGT